MLCAYSSKVSEERKLKGICRGIGCSQRNSEYRVGSEISFILAAVEFYKVIIQQKLIVGGQTLHMRSDNLVDILHRLEHSLAAIAALISVAKLHGLVATGAGSRGDYRPSEASVQ